MSGRNGLTLMELLVGTAAIALLACGLLPAVMRATSTRADLVCLQNQSSIWKAVTLYAADWDQRQTKNSLHFMNDNQFADTSAGESYHDARYWLPWSNALVQIPRSKLDDPARADPPISVWVASRADGDIWQSPVAYLPDISVFHCPREDRELDKSRWPGENYGLEINDWYYDIQGSYGLNNRMSSWDYVRRDHLARPQECFMFADSWAVGFDHVWEGDDLFSTRHGPDGEIVNIMFQDGHTEGRRFAPPVDEIPYASDTIIYQVSTPWYPGNSDWH